jgi:hypothetical protein
LKIKIGQNVFPAISGCNAMKDNDELMNVGCGKIALKNLVRVSEYELEFIPS